MIRGVLGLHRSSSLLAARQLSKLSSSSSATSKPKIRYLIVDGYDQAGRDELQAGDSATAGDLFVRMLTKCTPDTHRPECTIVYPADAGWFGNNPAKLDQLLHEVDAVAWTGCSLTIYETKDPRVVPQLQLTNRAFELGIPSFGSCWAAQIASVVAGGRVAPNPNGREMGIARKIHLTPEGRAHPMYIGKPTVFDAFTSHVDEVTHVPGLVLAGNAWTRVQAVTVTKGKGTFWGLQYHPEYELHDLARLTYCRLDKLTKMGFFQTREAGEKYVELLEALHADPKRKDIAWLLGIDGDVMTEELRWCEVRNWISHLVIPALKH
jgi:GMP synthase (glutamine-hydrolysing)